MHFPIAQLAQQWRRHPGPILRPWPRNPPRSIDDPHVRELQTDRRKFCRNCGSGSLIGRRQFPSRSVITPKPQLSQLLHVCEQLEELGTLPVFFIEPERWQPGTKRPHRGHPRRCPQEQPDLGLNPIERHDQPVQLQDLVIEVLDVVIEQIAVPLIPLVIPSARQIVPLRKPEHEAAEKVEFGLVLFFKPERQQLYGEAFPTRPGKLAQIGEMDGSNNIKCLVRGPEGIDGAPIKDVKISETRPVGQCAEVMIRSWRTQHLIVIKAQSLELQGFSTSLCTECTNT